MKIDYLGLLTGPDKQLRLELASRFAEAILRSNSDFLLNPCGVGKPQADKLADTVIYLTDALLVRLSGPQETKPETDQPS